MKKILIVDDAVTVRMYHRQILEEEGYQVDEAENGVEALEKALCDCFDLFLVDVNMPKMDGYRFLEEIRKTEALQAIPAIMISTEEDEQDKQKAYLSGANYYIVKPVDNQILKNFSFILAGGSE